MSPYGGPLRPWQPSAMTIGSHWLSTGLPSLEQHMGPRSSLTASSSALSTGATGTSRLLGAMTVATPFALIHAEESAVVLAPIKFEDVALVQSGPEGDREGQTQV